MRWKENGEIHREGEMLGRRVGNFKKMAVRGDLGRISSERTCSVVSFLSAAVLLSHKKPNLSALKREIL